MSKIVKARQNGGSVTLTLTGFVEKGKYYNIEKTETGEVVIREVEERKKYEEHPACWNLK